MSSNYEFTVGMSCGGCSGAVERNLKKVDGVEKYEISLETQTVKVNAPGLEYETVLGAIIKTGKKVTAGAEIRDGKRVEREVVLKE